MKFFRLRGSTGIVRNVSVAIMSVGLACGQAFADPANPAGGTMLNQTTPSVAEAKIGGPLANTAVSNARVMVADGTSLGDDFSDGAIQWFVVAVEPGRTYVIDVLDPYEDLGANSIGTLGVFQGDGTSAPLEADVDCSASVKTVAPSLEVSDDGDRCIVRTYVPSAGLNQAKRPLYLKVTQGAGNFFKIRVSDATIYGRWTTNGYDMHVELQNMTMDSAQVQVCFYPNSGLTYSAGAWSGAISCSNMTLPPFGAVKTTRLNGFLVGTDNKGTFRVMGSGLTPLVMNNQIHVNAYGFNTFANQYLPIPTRQANQGGPNSW